MDDPAALIDNTEFIVDMARYREGLTTQEKIKKRWRFDAAKWEQLGSDDQLVEAIEVESARRLRSGATAREKAQTIMPRVPDVLGTILDDENASPRHRIESARELRAVANVGPEAAPNDSERFLIKIVLGKEEGDVLEYDMPRKPNPPTINNSRDVIDADSSSLVEMLPALAGKREDGGGSGAPW